MKVSLHELKSKCKCFQMRYWPIFYMHPTHNSTHFSTWPGRKITNAHDCNYNLTEILKKILLFKIRRLMKRRTVPKFPKFWYVTVPRPWPPNNAIYWPLCSSVGRMIKHFLTYDRIDLFYAWHFTHWLQWCQEKIRHTSFYVLK